MEAATDDEATRSSRGVVAASVVALALFLPVAVALVALVAGDRWFPTGDMAQAELHVRGFWGNPPLVGAAGRIANSDGVQGSHPGPALWVAMWPVYALFGSSAAALQVSVAVVHLLTLGLVAWLAWRRGGWGLLLPLAVTLALVVRAGGPEVLTEPWNPWMALLPFVVALLASWSAVEGDLWAAPIAVAAASYAVQAHAGYALVMLGVLGLALVGVVWRFWRSDRRRALVLWVIVAFDVAVIAWIPPIVDQLRRDPGNLSILIDHFGSPNEPGLGLGRVVEIAALQLSLLGPWVLGAAHESFDLVAAVGLVGMVVLWGVGARSAWRRRADDELRLHGLLAAVWVLAVVSISRIFGPYFEYTIRWMWFVAALTVAASVWSLTRTWDGPSRRTAERAMAAVAAAVLVLAAVQFGRRAEPTGFADGELVGAVVPATVERLDPDARHLVQWWDVALVGAAGFGTLLELERAGFDVVALPTYAAAVLPHRTAPEDSVDAVLYVVTGEGPIATARTREGVDELAYADLRTTEEQAESARLRAEIEAALVDLGRDDLVALLDDLYGQLQLVLLDPPLPPELDDLVREYIDLGQPVAVFRAAPGTPVLPLGGGSR